jgi:hypothetical protein
MSREDTRLIFSNVPELALFADMFTERLERALGSVLDGGNGQDRVGRLFLDIVRPPTPFTSITIDLIAYRSVYRSRLWNPPTSSTSPGTPTPSRTSTPFRRRPR